MNNKEKKTNKGILITKICVNVIFYALIVLLLLFSIANINKKSEFEVPNLFGKGFLTVQTQSMEGKEKDSFTTNDVIFIKIVNDKNRDKRLSKVQVGDIITWKFSPISDKPALNTHRVVDIKEDQYGKYFITQGDRVAMNEDYKYNPETENNNVLDSTKFEKVYFSEVRGIYTGKWTGAGNFFKFLGSQNGFMLCIVLPVAIFFIVEVVILAVGIIKEKQKKQLAGQALELEQLKQEQLKLLEEEKERMRAEILAEQAKKEQENKEE